MGIHNFNTEPALRPVSSVEAWRRKQAIGSTVAANQNAAAPVRPNPRAKPTVAGPADRRSRDLDWQIRFAKMKLRGWQDPDNADWTPLDGLLNEALRQRTRLG